MGSSGTPPDATLHDAEGVFSGSEEPSTPRSTTEVATELDCDAEAAAETLQALADRGELRSRVVDGETRVWWRPADTAASENGHDEAVEFRAFVDAVKDYAIFTLEPDGTVANWNEGAARIKGYDREEIVGEHFSAFYTDEDVAEGVPEGNLQRAAEAGHVEDEGWRVRADGTAFWANVTITAIRDDDGDLRGFTKVTRDMTERREYEQQLRRERDQTEQVLRTAPVAIAVHDADGETLVANRQARDSLGLREGKHRTAPTDRDGWTVTDANGESVPADGSPTSCVLDSGEPVFDEEIVVEAPEGEPARLRMNAATVTDEDGEIDRVVTVAEDVTELRRRERQLEERESELESELSEVLGRISDAFYAVDDEWRFTHLNDRAVEILGRERENLLGRELWTAFPESDEAYREHFERAMATQEPEHFEVYEDGADTWLEFTAYPSESGLSIYFRDVSERKARERDLERYETLFTESTDVNAVLNPDGTFAYLPPSVEKVLGYEQDDLLGQNAFDLVHPEDRERIAGEFERLVAEPDYQPTNEFRFRHADGHWVWLESVGRNLLSDPSIEGIVAYTRDVTERVERERQLRRTERSFQAIFEDPNILVGLLDPDGTVQDINGTAMEYVDADLEAVVDEPFWETPWWGTGDGIREDVREWTERAAAGEYVEFEADLTRPDGEPYALEGFFRPVTDDDGNVVSVIVSDRDVTERRVRERALEESERRYRTLAEYFPNGIVTLFDEELTYELAAGQGFTDIPVSADDLEGSQLSEVWDAETVATLEPLFEAAIAGEERSVELEYEGRNWVVRAVPITDERGEVFAGMTMAQDITERKARERALEESERRYRTLAENFPNGAVGVYDHDLRYTLAAGAKLGSDLPPAEELEGSRMSEIFPEDVRADLEGLFRRAIDDGVTDSTTTALGGRIWRVWAAPLVDADGDIFGGLSLAQDVTEEMERRTSLERYEAIVETVDDGIYVKNDEGNFTMVNEAYADLTGYDEDELVGAHASMVVDEETIDESGTIEAATDDGPNPTLEAPIQRADGETVPAEASFGAFETAGGEVRHVGVVRDVSERKKRERRLARQRAYTDAIVDAIDDVFYVLDADGQLLRWNESLEAVTGYASEEIAEMEASGFFAEADSDAAAAAVREGFQTGSVEMQLALRTSDGEEVPFEFVASTLESPDGETVLAGIGRDVTDRVERERRLEESERRYRTLAENFPQGAVGLFDENLEYTAAGGQFLDEVGVSKDDRIGNTVYDVYPDELVTSIEPYFQAVLRGEANTFEVEFHGRYIEAHTLPVTDADDEVIAGMLVVQDVTERKERERTLQRRAHQQAVVADLGQYALEAEDLDDLMREASRQVTDVLDNDYCMVLDLDPDAGELLLRQGVGWRDGIVGQATVDANENSQAGYTLRSEEPVVVDDLDGETRFSGPELLTSHDVESGVSTIIGSVEEPWGVLGTHDTAHREFTQEDVNFVKAVANVLAEAIERHRYQDELEALVADLEESNERLEQFAYAASHDLQEPLRMVSSYLQLIERRYGDALDEDGEEFLEFAVDGADRMREMIDGLLAYSRVDTRGDPFEPVDLGAVLEDACTDLRVTVEEHDAEITAGDLPRVEGDPGQLRQLFQNLLDNAIDYSGDEPPRVHVSAERAGDRWQIAVRDEGVGVDPADADRIFEVFQTLHTRDDQGGTGIGLALCERIVQRHGGEIDVDSQPGEGATFTFTLPAIGADDE